MIQCFVLIPVVRVGDPVCGATVLVMTELKKAEKGTSTPHVFPMFLVDLESGSGRALSQSFRNILSICTFDKFYMTVSNQVTDEVSLDIAATYSAFLLLKVKPPCRYYFQEIEPPFIDRGNRSLISVIMITFKITIRPTD
jgi:hypothetical protein